LIPCHFYQHRSNVEHCRVRSRRISLSDALIETLPRITAPIAGPWGALDATSGDVATTDERRRIFQRHQPDCRFTVIANSGHLIMYERPKSFVEAILQEFEAHQHA